jgi:hypothetical protein
MRMLPNWSKPIGLSTSRSFDGQLPAHSLEDRDGVHCSWRSLRWPSPRGGRRRRTWPAIRHKRKDEPVGGRSLRKLVEKPGERLAMRFSPRPWKVASVAVIPRSLFSTWKNGVLS